MQRNTANIKFSHEGGYQDALHLISSNANIPAIGVDDIETAQYLSPMLTIIHIPLEEIGKMTTKIFIDRITEGHRIPLKIVLPCYIAKRDICGKTPRNQK